MEESQRPPLPPFSLADATAKVRRAENAWNGKNPAAVALAYSVNSVWRNRHVFLQGRSDIVKFLTEKWQKELEYRLIKELWAYGSNRIAVRFVYEWHDTEKNWFRSCGNENWEFDELGLMRARHASINDVAIEERERAFRWAAGPRPDDHPGLSDLGL